MLDTALEAASAAGKLLRQNFGSTLNVNHASHHDIKLEIDEQAQRLITKVILADFPDHAILGEEGIAGCADGDVRWVIDPLDGTVNYFYGIPHYAVSIAVQVRTKPVGAAFQPRPGSGDRDKNVAPTNEADWQTVAGVVYDPELDEMFAGTHDGPATLNGQPVRVSNRAELAEAIISIGFFKSQETIRAALTDFSRLVQQVRKVRIQGAAALDVAYVACGRYDAYLEYGIKLWDIAAGQLILARAGGRATVLATPEPHTFNVQMTNGKINWSFHE